MSFLYNLFLTLHFIGLAGLLGGLLAQISAKPKKLPPFVLHSGWLMLIAGIAMVGINQIRHADDPTVEVLDHVKVAIKSTVLVVILVLGYLNIRKSELSSKVWGLMTALLTVNVVIAVFI